MMRLIFFILFLAITTNSFAVEQDAAALITSGIALREKGNITLSIQTLSEANRLAKTPEEKIQAAGELGSSLFQARRYAEAESATTEAYNAAQTSDKARYAMDLGNIAAAQQKPEQARAFYKQAQLLATNDPIITAGSALNLVRLMPDEQRMAMLADISPQLAAIDDPINRARLSINLGKQAHKLGASGTQLAYTEYQNALSVLKKSAMQGQANSRLQAEALDGLAQLYEDQQRTAESMQLNQQALQVANRLESTSVADLLITLHWRQGRLHKAQGNKSEALVSYQRAVNNIESIRLDIPLEYEDGQSSFKALFEPIYTGLSDLLLQNAAGMPPAQQQPLLQSVSSATELLKQSEMQDFLGDRCAIEEIKGGKNNDTIASNTVVFYPLVFDDRTEILININGVMTRFTSPVSKAELREEVARYEEQLRYQESNYLARSQKLYQWLIGPTADILEQQGIHNLVIVPDSSLRVLPFSSLHDGKQYLAERFSVASVAGISMTTIGDEGVINNKQMNKSLVVGMSSPGAVVNKLAEMERNTSSGTDSEKDAFVALRMSSIKQDLALPSVDKEMNAMKNVLQGDQLKNEDFTLENFAQKIESGNYQILHIASHGVFGGTEETSYIMAHDNIIKMNDLQKILDTSRNKNNHIRLLSLSACQTAEGSDAAPIGISGAAIKARARSVLGTLWPVQDASTQTFMKLFYEGITKDGLSKTDAVQQAQIAMINDPALSHPFFWAPFTLIGNWE